MDFQSIFALLFKWILAFTAASWAVGMMLIVVSAVLWTLFGFSLFSIFRRLL